MENDVPSPFLPGTHIQVAWDSTSLGALKTCPRYYQYFMIDRWQGRDENVHLRFGIEFHQALQDYDILKNEGEKHEEALHTVVQELLLRVADWSPEHKYKNRRNLLRTVIDYLDKYKDDPAKTFIMENGYPAVELSFRFELPFGPEASVKPCPTCNGTGFTGPETGYDSVCSECGGQKLEDLAQLYIICGHLDRVVTFNDDLYVMDRKTTTIAPSEYYFAQFEPNNQMTLYAIAGEIVLNTPIQGIIIDAAAVKVDTSEFGRGMTYRDKAKVDEWLEDLGYWLSLAENYAERNHWPMNDTACDKYGGCRFREICSSSPKVRDRFLKSNFVQGEQWNPLKTR